MRLRRDPASGGWHTASQDAAAEDEEPRAADRRLLELDEVAAANRSGSSDDGATPARPEEEDVVTVDDGSSTESDCDIGEYDGDELEQQHDQNRVPTAAVTATEAATGREAAPLDQEAHPALYTELLSIVGVVETQGKHLKDLVAQAQSDKQVEQAAQQRDERKLLTLAHAVQALMRQLGASTSEQRLLYEKRLVAETTLLRTALQKEAEKRRAVERVLKATDTHIHKQA